MGAWGCQFDENDDAADWLSDFTEEPSWKMVEQTLKTVIPDGDYIEAPECSMALAAAEVVAAGLGRPSPRLDAAILTWAKANAANAAAYSEMARQATASVRDASELKELWQDDTDVDPEDSSEWLSSVNDLLSRLG